MTALTSLKADVILRSFPQLAFLPLHASPVWRAPPHPGCGLQSSISLTAASSRQDPRLMPKVKPMFSPSEQQYPKTRMLLQQGPWVVRQTKSPVLRILNILSGWKTLGREESPCLYCFQGRKIRTYPHATRVGRKWSNFDQSNFDSSLCWFALVCLLWLQSSMFSLPLDIIE